MRVFWEFCGMAKAIAEGLRHHDERFTQIIRTASRA
jgi:hypothetical protein